MAHNTQVQLRTGLSISQFGLGTATLGGLFQSITESEVDSLVASALRNGISFIDTAPHYGKGTSERRLARTLKGVPRSSYVLSTKIGRILVPTPGASDDSFADADNSVERVFDFSASGVERSFKDSLERLGQDKVDIVFIHDPDGHGDQAITEAYPALEKMRNAGLISAIGVGMNQSAIPTRFVKETDIDIVLIAGRYSLLDQSAAKDLLPAAAARGVDIIAAGVFNSGILANPVKGATYDYAPASDAMLARAQRINAILTSAGVSIAQAAMQFPLRNPVVKGILVGCRSAQEVESNIAYFDKTVPEEVWTELANVQE